MKMSFVPRVILAGLFAVSVSCSAVAQTVSASSGGVISNLPVTQVQGGTGTSPLMLPHWRACLAKVQAKQGNCAVEFVGDSLFAGGPQYIVQNITYQLAIDFNNVGIPTNNNGWSGNGNYTRQSTSGGDDRITFPAWGNSGQTTLGGYFYTSNSSTANFVYSPGANSSDLPFNTCQATYWSITGNGAATLTATGGTPVTVPSEPSGIYTATATAAATSATNTCTIAAQTSNDFYLVGMDAWNSAVSSIQLQNDGWPGITSSVILTSGAAAYSPLQTLETRDAPLVVLEGGVVNDWNNSVPSATTYANVSAMVAAILANGQDVILVVGAPNPDNPTIQAQDVVAFQQIAAQYGIPFVNWNARWVSPYVSAPLGYYYTDDVHGSPLGYMDIANALFAIMRPQ